MSEKAEVVSPMGSRTCEPTVVPAIEVSTSEIDRGQVRNRPDSLSESDSPDQYARDSIVKSMIENPGLRSPGAGNFSTAGIDTTTITTTGKPASKVCSGDIATRKAEIDEHHSFDSCLVAKYSAGSAGTSFTDQQLLMQLQLEREIEREKEFQKRLHIQQLLAAQAQQHRSAYSTIPRVPLGIYWNKLY